MHKMIHADLRRINSRFRRLIVLLNLPSAAICLSLAVIVNVVLRNASNALYLYRIVIYAMYGCAAYSFLVTFILSLIQTFTVRGHKNNTYIEIFNSKMIVSRHAGTGFEDGHLCDYRKMWVIRLCDIQNVTCVRSRMNISAKARYFEGKSRWFIYGTDELGDPDFDYWWNSEHGGTAVDEVRFEDVFTYADRVAQRIVFCAEKHKAREIKRQEFRKRMLEIAGHAKKRGKGLSQKYKRSERVFR